MFLKRLVTGLRVSNLPFSAKRSMIQVQSAIPPHNFKISSVGNYGEMDYRVFFTNNTDNKISPWHDIPLIAGKTETDDVIFNYINEISRGKVEKMEINKTEEWNPIKQDIKKGVLRKIKYCPYLWNYGAFPQTWEDPTVPDPATGLVGDGDPVDVCELGVHTHNIGDVIRVKVIGALGLIDEGETDWKILAINIADPIAHYVNGPGDLKKCKPGMIDSLRDFFINYKVPDGKPQNKLAFNGDILDQATALKLIEDSHRQYKSIFDKPNLGYSLRKRTT